MVKKKIDVVEFEKRVEIEYSFLVYHEGFKEDEAMEEAKRFIASRFEVVSK